MEQFKLVIKSGMIALFVVAFSACAKKDDSNKSSSRLSPTAGQTGARSVNPVGSQSALDVASSQGVSSFHIDRINSPRRGTVSGYNALIISSNVIFNGQSMPLETYHDEINDVTKSSVLRAGAGEFTLEAQGICSDINCSVYYLVLNVYKGSLPVIQLVHKQNFTTGYNSQSLSNYQGPSNFITSLTDLFRVLN